MIFLDIDERFTNALINNVNDDGRQVMTAEERMQLIAKATLDKRLNARDLKLYNYIVCYEYLGFTQEQISELLDLSRSNINKSLEKLASFNYIEKKDIRLEDENKRKRMKYVAKRIDSTGFIGYFPDDIIRVLNVSNVSDSKLKYYYCSMENYHSYVNAIDECERHLNFIEENYSNEELAIRKRVTELVEAYSPRKKSVYEALDVLKGYINDMTAKTEDTKMMIRKLNRFYKQIKSSDLSSEALDKVLGNEHARLILFLDRTKDESFENFREKYLEDYIRFVCAFTDLYENEDFFKLYYENKKIELTFSEMIKLLGFTHREVPHMRQSAIKSIETSLEEFLDKFDGIELSETSESVLDEIVEIYHEHITTDAVYDSRQISLILYVTEKMNYLKYTFGLEFNTFIEIYNSDLVDVIKEFNDIKKLKN